MNNNIRVKRKIFEGIVLLVVSFFLLVFDLHSLTTFSQYINSLIIYFFLLKNRWGTVPFFYQL